MDTALTLGKKIREIRKAKGLSQDNLANGIKCSASAISRIEGGEADCGDEILAAIKKYMEIEKAPMLEYELTLFKNRLIIWCDMITDYRMSDAHTIRNELSIIEQLPFERDLAALYAMIDTRLLFYEHKIPAAMEKLKAAEPLLDNASEEVHYLFHRNSGFAYTAANNWDKALSHYLKCLDYSNGEIKPDASIWSNIGTCYAHLGKPIRAISYLEQAIMKYGNNHAHIGVAYTNLVLTNCYTAIGELNIAKKHAKATLLQTQSLGDKITSGWILFIRSVICLKEGNPAEGLEFIEQASPCFQGHEPSYLRSFTAYPDLLVNKALCLLEIKNLTECKNVIEQGKLLAEGDEKLAIIFEALNKLMTLRDTCSTKYIENIAIPYLRKIDISSKETVLDLCDRLEAHYRKRGANKKADAIAVIYRDVHKEIICGVSS